MCMCVCFGLIRPQFLRLKAYIGITLFFLAHGPGSPAASDSWCSIPVSCSICNIMNSHADSCTHERLGRSAREQLRSLCTDCLLKCLYFEIRISAGKCCIDFFSPCLCSLDYLVRLINPQCSYMPEKMTVLLLVLHGFPAWWSCLYSSN